MREDKRLCSKCGEIMERFSFKHTKSFTYAILCGIFAILLCVIQIVFIIYSKSKNQTPDFQHFAHERLCLIKTM